MVGFQFFENRIKQLLVAERKNTKNSSLKNTQPALCRTVGSNNNYFCILINKDSSVKMKNIFRLFLLIAIAGTTVSCKTDFDVIADYKEVAIVYGLLNQNDTVHYLRINKAFLGEGNALVYAMIPDSSSYGTDIEVVLFETMPSGQTREIVFDTVTLCNKEKGDSTFYYPCQLFYKANAILNADNIYDLKITNKKTGNVVTAQTKLIGDFNFTEPSGSSKYLSFKKTITTPHTIAWENALNGKRYQLVFHFNYKEFMGIGDTALREADWVFPSVTSEYANGNGESELLFQNEEFYTFCQTKIRYSDPAKEGAVITRYSSDCDLEMTVIGEAFNTYLDVNGPATGVVMEKPQYSNITNGIGLFSSRYQIHTIKQLNSETKMDLSKMNLKFAIPAK